MGMKECRGIERWINDFTSSVWERELRWIC